MKMASFERAQKIFNNWDKEAADRAAAQRDEHHEDKNLADLFTHEGDLRCFYVEEKHIDALLQSGS